tara:strand:+ start:1649 stop:2008 length:360 start_codon:yes stop_codon:yes gene_type:complete
MLKIKNPINRYCLIKSGVKIPGKTLKFTVPFCITHYDMFNWYTLANEYLTYLSDGKTVWDSCFYLINKKHLIAKADLSDKFSDNKIPLKEFVEELKRLDFEKTLAEAEAFGNVSEVYYD